MTGILETTAVPHHCRPPDIREFGEPRNETGVPTVYLRCPEGSRYHCDCGTTWVVVDMPPYNGPRVHIVNGLRWRRETRHQRRKRLGVRWWQREFSRLN